MLQRIQKIISAHPYTVVCQWTNGEVRAIELGDKIKEWAMEPNSIFKKLLDEHIFNTVNLNQEAKTLYWPGLLKMEDTAGHVLPADLDLDPEILYQLSIPFR